MKPRYSPQQHLITLTQSWIGSILIMGSILFTVLGFMDYYVSPHNFTKFMVYRLAVSALLLVLYYLNGLRQGMLYQYSLATIGAVLSGITVELAILQSGGQNSTYYAAMMILAICCLGFAPMNMPLSFLLVTIVYTIYLVPILLTEEITSGVFISNNAFLIATFVIGLLLRYHNQKLIVSEMQLRAELSEDKRKLELYSNSLKDEVAEKSGALAITEQKYRALFDNANDGIAVLDSEGNITDVNQSFCELHGFERKSVLGTNFRLLEIENQRGDIDKRLRRILNGESLVYEAEHYRKDGTRIFLEISSRAIEIGGVPHIQSFHRDITEKIKLQEQVMQSQKMESMGLLAGGIAHDFKNVLTAILAHTEVLRRHVKTDEFGKRRINTIEDSARRAGQMISKLLSFARKESLQLVPTEINTVVMDSVELLSRALLDRNIKMQVILEPTIPLINGDGIHLEQVLANLVMNSMDAMPSGGMITIATAERVLTSDSPEVSPFLPPGKYVVLHVKDTGTGIPRDIMDKIFDPFFTTKPAGKGTGLGLAMAYGIVKSHKGEIRVESTEKVGTIFELFFPVPVETSPSTTVQAISPVRSITRRKRVLAVDDDPDILSFMQDTLAVNGYEVIAAASPEQAIDIFKRLSGSIDAVITDIVMPNMNGAELAAILRQLKPGIKVIGISAFDTGPAVQDFVRHASFLKKPFNGTDLRNALEAGVSDAAAGA